MKIFGYTIIRTDALEYLRDQMFLLKENNEELLWERDCLLTQRIELEKQIKPIIIKTKKSTTNKRKKK